MANCVPAHEARPLALQPLLSMGQVFIAATANAHLVFWPGTEARELIPADMFAGWALVSDSVAVELVDLGFGIRGIHWVCGRL